MNDIFAEILKKYGIAAVIFAGVASFFIWFLAHWAASPGTEVSVLWGLVKYTKQSENGSKENLSYVVPETTVAQKSEKKKAADSDNNEKGSNADIFEEVSITFLNNITNENLKSAQDDLRTQMKLRSLSTMESGKTVNDLPSSTYFYIYPVEMTNSSCCPKTILERVGEASAKRYPTFRSDIETYKSSSSDLYAVLFVSEIDIAKISKLSGKEEHSIVAATTAWNGFTSMACIPIRRVLTSEKRDLQVSERDSETILDIVLK